MRGEIGKRVTVRAIAPQKGWGDKGEGGEASQAKARARARELEGRGRGALNSKQVKLRSPRGR